MMRITFVDDFGSGALRRVAPALLALVLLFGLPAGAHAAQTHVLSGHGPSDFGLGDPEGVAVDQSGGPGQGHVWVATDGYVALLDANAASTNVPILPASGFFGNPISVAVDNTSGPSAGDAYIADAGTNTVYKFAPDGTPIWEVNGTSPVTPEALGMSVSAVAVDPSNGNVVILGASSYGLYGVLVLDSDGNYVRIVNFPFRGGRDVAVDGNGNFYVVGFPSGAGWYGVDEYDPAGHLVRRLDDDDSRGVSYDTTNDQVVANDGDHIAIYDAASGAKVDDFGAGTLVDGSAVDVVEATGYVYALDRTDRSFTGQVDIFRPANLPDVSVVEPVSAVGQTSVTVHGHVDPAGASDPSCEFEYGDTTSYGGVNSPITTSPAGPYHVATDVSATITGLSPATAYHYRLNCTNSAGTGHSADATLTTGPGVPVVVGETLADRGSDHARIDSTVQVMGATASAHIDYGTTTSYGSTAPMSGKSVVASGPSDQDSKLVPIELSGLTPDTTYHYRISVTNSAGTRSGVDQTFHTFASPESTLPDGRHYELVSPVEKHGHTLVTGYAIATDDGSAIQYAADGPVGNASSGAQNIVVARRVAGHWTPDNLYQRAVAVNINHLPRAGWPSSDLTKQAFSGIGFTNDGDTAGLFISDRTSTIRASTSALSPTPIGPALASRAQHGTPTWTFVPAGAAPDLNPTYFGYDGALLAADSDRVPHLANHDVAGFYEYKDGQLQPAGTLPDGTLDPYGAVPASTTAVADEASDSAREIGGFNNQVSTDGSRAFFVSPAPVPGSPRPSQLYVHREGKSSLLASRVASSGAEAPTGVVGLADNGVIHYDTPYAVASPTGSYVFFESQDALTSDAPAGSSTKGYLFDVATSHLTYLAGVDGTPFTVSDDGARVFFLSAAGDVALWSAGSGVSVVAQGAGVVSSSQATPDGSVLMFMPSGAPVGFDTGGQDQVFRYDTNAAKLDCISCPTDGLPTGAALLAGNTNRGYNDDYFARAVPYGQLKAPHMIADGGRRIFFDTPDQLVATDTNAARDVYEWQDGKLHLISGGHGSKSSFLLDSSASGDDVFFGTTDSFDARDTDGAYDVYDARVANDGAVDTTPAPCSEACQGPGAGEVDQPAVATSGASAGNVVLPARPAALKVTVRSKKVKGTTLTLTLGVSGKGHLTVSSPRVTTARKTTTKKANYTVSVRLTAAARRDLRRHHRLVVALRVSFSSSTGKSSVTTVSLTVKG